MNVFRRHSDINNKESILSIVEGYRTNETTVGKFQPLVMKNNVSHIYHVRTYVHIYLYINCLR